MTNGYGVGRSLTRGAVTRPKRNTNAGRITPEIHAFMLEKHQLGWGLTEICRGIFKQYGRDTSPNTVYKHLKKEQTND
jgi:hypothetical protein